MMLGSKGKQLGAGNFFLDSRFHRRAVSNRAEPNNDNSPKYRRHYEWLRGTAFLRWNTLAL